MNSSLPPPVNSGCENWQPSGAPPPLEEGQVQVWRTRLDLSQSLMECFFAVLSPDEQQRARRFRFEADGRYFTAARATLRFLLGKFLATDPAEVRFEYGATGKPALRASTALPIHFNISHCRALAICAFTLNRPVGIDIEKVRPGSDFEEIARTNFAPAEFSELMSVPGDLRPKRFLQLWTCKEACAKAIGMGLSIPLHAFELSIGPDDSVRLVAFNAGLDATSSWTLCLLTPFPDTVACVAAQAAALQVCRYEFLPSEARHRPRV